MAFRFRSYNLKHDEFPRCTSIAEGNDRALVVADEDFEDVDPGWEDGYGKAILGPPESNRAIQGTRSNEF